MCPVTETKLPPGNCLNSKCMYHKKAFKNHCANAAVTGLRGKGLPKAELKARMADVYGVDVEETEIAIRRVVALLCLNEYFMYVFGKQLMEAKAKDLADVKSNQVRYDAWRSGSRKVSFVALSASVDFVLTNLK